LYIFSTVQIWQFCRLIHCSTSIAALVLIIKVRLIHQWSTFLTTSYQVKLLNTKKKRTRHMPKAIRVLNWDRKTGMSGLKWIMGSDNAIRNMNNLSMNSTTIVRDSTILIYIHMYRVRITMYCHNTSIWNLYHVFLQQCITFCK
jgi:hypothetical protein